MEEIKVEKARKPISKKLRFEIFKRDNFTCQYCGNISPNVVLEIDHIKAVSNGGDNSIDNLLTSCFDCNRGKGKNNISMVQLSLEKKIEIEKEKKRQYKVYQKLLSEKADRFNFQIDLVEAIFLDYFDLGFSPKFRLSVRKFIELLGIDEVVISAQCAINRIDDPMESAVYFCGICWNKIKNK